MYKKSPQEIDLMQEGATILSQLLGELTLHVNPGITTRKLDNLAAQFMKQWGVQSSFKGYEGFPSVLCTSVNHAVVHGIPNEYVLQEGDIISIDCGVYHKGYHSDAAFTYIVGELANVKKELVNLCLETEKVLELAVEKVAIGNRVGDIGYTISSLADQLGYNVVREYGGHGIGKKLHQLPHIPNFGARGNGIKIQEGMVVAIEPILTLESREVVEGTDKWKVYTKDDLPCAHFEHTVAVVDGKPKKLTTFEYIRQKIAKK
ncbi:MAG: type I methionyl aminopeptidase [Bacteroidota bacterium]